MLDGTPPDPSTTVLPTGFKGVNSWLTSSSDSILAECFFLYRQHALMSACVHMYTCRLASKEAELQNVEKLLLGIFGVPLQEQKQLMRDMLKTMTMLQSKIVITYVFLVPVY